MKQREIIRDNEREREREKNFYNHGFYPYLYGVSLYKNGQDFFKHDELKKTCSVSFWPILELFLFESSNHTNIITNVIYN